jgi:hypothetical protein
MWDVLAVENRFSGAIVTALEGCIAVRKYYLCPVMMVHYTMELVNATGPSLRDRGSM